MQMKAAQMKVEPMKVVPKTGAQMRVVPTTVAEERRLRECIAYDHYSVNASMWRTIEILTNSTGSARCMSCRRRRLWQSLISRHYA